MVSASCTFERLFFIRTNFGAGMCCCGYHNSDLVRDGTRSASLYSVLYTISPLIYPPLLFHTCNGGDRVPLRTKIKMLCVSGLCVINVTLEFGMAIHQRDPLIVSLPSTICTRVAHLDPGHRRSKVSTEGLLCPRCGSAIGCAPFNPFAIQDHR